MTRSLGDDMARFGNLAQRPQLYSLGYSKRDLQLATNDGTLQAILRHWVVHPGAEVEAVRAVALGGQLGGASALASHGVWLSRRSGLWVATLKGSSHHAPVRLGEKRLWGRPHFAPPDDKRWRMSVPDSLLQFALTGSSTDVIASMDSALRQSLIRPDQLDAVFDLLPRRLRRLRARVNGKADSGLETIIRLAAEAEGWQVEIQVRIDAVGRVDILIDGWLVIECDGRAFHDNAQAMAVDRRRDAELTLRGYRYQRFEYHQIMQKLPQCVEVMRTILSGGRPPRPGIRHN
jgi:very-short-patch-repair endonuclease